jgi:hypothetical protein
MLNHQLVGLYLSTMGQAVFRIFFVFLPFLKHYKAILYNRLAPSSVPCY